MTPERLEEIRNDLAGSRYPSAVGAETSAYEAIEELVEAVEELQARVKELEGRPRLGEEFTPDPSKWELLEERENGQRIYKSKETQ